MFGPVQNRLQQRGGPALLELILRNIYILYMKITFPIPQNDDKQHELCSVCHQGNVYRFQDAEGIVKFECPHCGAIKDRFLGIDNSPNGRVWWIDSDNEMWHESAGIFVRRPDGKYLFFERVAFPFGYTVPAGHVDKSDDTAADTAMRELHEEVGIGATVARVVTTNIIGDKCIGGADCHKWSIFVARINHNINVEVLEKQEGKHPVWLTLEEAATKELPFAIRYIIDHFSEAIERSE